MLKKKLSKEFIKKVKEAWGDWEVTHSLRDDAMIDRLLELDPEFMEQLDKLFEDATFWYA